MGIAIAFVSVTLRFPKTFVCIAINCVSAWTCSILYYSVTPGTEMPLAPCMCTHCQKVMHGSFDAAHCKGSDKRCVACSTANSSGTDGPFWIPLLTYGHLQP